MLGYGASSDTNGTSYDNDDCSVAANPSNRTDRVSWLAEAAIATHASVVAVSHDAVVHGLVPIDTDVDESSTPIYIHMW